MKKTSLRTATRRSNLHKQKRHLGEQQVEAIPDLRDVIIQERREMHNTRYSGFENP